MKRTLGAGSKGTRQGNSLSEQLVALAIVVSLVGFAVPFFQGYLRQARSARIRQDLDHLVQAIARWSREKHRPLTGASLEPLLQGYLSHLPKDPWGHDYFFDGNLGVVGCFGADGIEFGEFEAEDTILQYQKQVQIRDVRLVRGGFGLVQKGDRLEVSLSKPIQVLPGAESLVASDFDLHPPQEGGVPMDLEFLGYVYRPELSHPEFGHLVFLVPESQPLAQNYFLGQGVRLALTGFVSSLRELPMPPEISRIQDPSRFLWGFEPASRSDGTWGGMEIRREGNSPG